jgi:hypothetical protein
MSVILTLLMFVILLASVAMLFAEGMWTNAIRLVNVVTAALLATNFFEPLARLLDRALPSGGYFWDFLSLWVLFCVVFSVLRLATDNVSKVKVRFPALVDRVGGGVLAAWVGWVLVCFTMMTLHTAPLARNFLFEGFQPESQMIAGLAPDRQWLGFAQKMSLGTFSRSAGSQHAFDPNGEFPRKYAGRRQQIQDNVASRGSISGK